LTDFNGEYTNKASFFWRFSIVLRALFFASVLCREKIVDNMIQLAVIYPWRFCQITQMSIKMIKNFTLGLMALLFASSSFAMICHDCTSTSSGGMHCEWCEVEK
jgi:hypothetical protein